MQYNFLRDFQRFPLRCSARFFGILPPRIRQILTSERLPQTIQMSCGLSLTTSHSAHNTAYCRATVFRSRPAGRLSKFGWFMSGPWEEDHLTQHFAGDCQSERMAHLGHCLCSSQEFLIRDGVPNLLVSAQIREGRSGVSCLGLKGEWSNHHDSRRSRPNDRTR
jgi:hypothetical protein